MPKENREHIAKTGAVWHLSAEEAALVKKPRYNAYICRTGPHGSAKHDRASSKRAWVRELRKER